jgi:aryl-phospho-beta-D-glucosidase BglC (GH1 family)
MTILHRQGNQLVNANGQVVVLHGTTGVFVDSGQGGWQTTSGYVNNISACTQQLDLMKQWGFNSIRLTISVELWTQNIDNDQANTIYLIQQAQQRGMYVTITPWSVLYSGDSSGEWVGNALPYPPYQGTNLIKI